MKIYLKDKLKNYKTYISFIFFLFFLPYKVIMFEPHIAWILDKNNSIVIKDKFYSRLVKSIPKNYVVTKQKIIFLQKNGKVISTVNKENNFIISGFYGKNGIIIYTKTKGIISYFNGNGEKMWDYKTYAYPFALGTNIILLVTGENAGFKTMDKNKNEMSDFIATGSIALSFSAPLLTDNWIAIGFSDGSLILYNKTLKIEWTKKIIFDSIYPIIKKVAFSPKGKYIAALSGLENEYLYVFDNSGRTILSYKTGENRRRGISLKFSANEKYLVEESDTGFRLYSIEDTKLLFEKKLFNKNYKRQIISMDISKTGKYIIVAYKYNDNAVIIDLFNDTGSLLFRDYMVKNSLPLVKFSKESNSFIIETRKGFYVYEI